MAVFRDKYKVKLAQPSAVGEDLYLSATPELLSKGWVSSDNGLMFDIMVSESDRWSIMSDCTYTQATNKLSRGTLIKTSDPSNLPISFTVNALVENVLTSEKMSEFLTPKTINYVNVKDFGAVGDGVTDDTSAFQAAVSASINKEMIIPDGIYRASNINLPSNISINIFGNAKIIQATSAQSVFKITGTNGADISLVADAAAGDTTIQISNTVGLLPDDWIIIRDTVDYSTESAALGYKSGETCEILSVDSGTQITLKNKIYGSMLASKSYQVANGANIIKVTPANNVKITGGKIELLNSSNTNGIEAQFVNNLVVDGVTIDNIAGSGVLLLNCRNAVVRHCTIMNGKDRVDLGQPGYGVCIGHASHNVTVESNNLIKLRHGVTTVGGSYGFPHLINYNGNTVTRCTNAGLDTHESGQDISISYNTVSDCSGGIALRTGYSIVRGNTIVRSLSSGIGIAGINLSDVDIIGNYVKEINDYGFSTPSACPRLRVSGNTFTNIGQDVISLFGGVGDDKLSPGLVIESNVINNFGTVGTNRAGIQIAGTFDNNPYIVDNIITRGTGSASRGIYFLATITQATVRGNKVIGSYASGNYVLGASVGNFENDSDSTPSRNKLISLANDSFIAITFSSSYNLIAFIASTSISSGQPNSMFRFRPNSSPSCVLMSPAITNVIFQTGALTGTTGAVGTVTISAVNGGLHIENRSGSAANFSLLILGTCF